MVYKKKEKLSRREGVNLYLKGARSHSDKSGLARRPFKPGQHSHKPSRLTVYGRQLREKQKVKRMYLMREKAFKKLFREALRIAENKKIDKGLVFLQMLDRKLDVVLYYAGLAKSKNAGRQMVVHGHVKVNGVRTRSPSRILEPGDIIEVSPKVFEKYRRDYEGPAVPAWLEVDKNVAKIVRLPTREEISKDIDESLIIAWYTR